MDDEEEEDEDDERDGEGGAPRETSLASGAACISTVYCIVVLVARALNCKPHFYVSSSSSCLLPRALTLASPLSHHSNCAGPACSAAGYRKAEDEMSGTTSQADPIDATARIVLLNRAQTTKFCDNHVR